MTDHVTPEEVRERADLIRPSYPWAAEALDSLAAQLEEMRALVGTATDGEEVLRRLAGQNKALTAQLKAAHKQAGAQADALHAELHTVEAQLEAAQEVIEAARGAMQSLHVLRRTLAAYDKQVKP